MGLSKFHKGYLNRLSDRELNHFVHRSGKYSSNKNLRRGELESYAEEEYSRRKNKGYKPINRNSGSSYPSLLGMSIDSYQRKRGGWF